MHKSHLLDFWHVIFIKIDAFRILTLKVNFYKLSFSKTCMELCVQDFDRIWRWQPSKGKTILPADAIQNVTKAW